MKGALTRGLAVAAALLACADAAAQGMLRGGQAELSISPLYTAGRSYNFPNGASTRTESTVGLGIQWAYNFDDHWSAGVEGAFNGANYTAHAAPAVGNNSPAIDFSARAQTTTLRLAATYHISTAQFTPFVTVGAGVTGIDTNVPTGAVPGCYWYPYWGQVCGDAPSKRLTEFSYSAAVGVRYDLRSASFFRAAYNREWIDFGANTGALAYDQLRIDFGIRF